MSNLAKNLVENMSDEEKIQVRNWAKSAYVIRNDESISSIQKIKQLMQLTSREKLLGSFFKKLGKIIKKHSWDERALAGKLALSGLVIGATISGTKMAGIATAGLGVGIPVYILTSAGGAFLGTIIQETSNTIKKNKKK